MKWNALELGRPSIHRGAHILAALFIRNHPGGQPRLVMPVDAAISSAQPQQYRRFHVVALQVPIVFNRDGGHDHNGLMFALERNRAELETLRQEMQDGLESSWCKTPHRLVRPLVLRAGSARTRGIHFVNHIEDRSRRPCHPRNVGSWRPYDTTSPVRSGEAESPWR